ncbi:MAG: hypothetical protein Hens3KO_17500 [Henriciella sp.]
MIKYNFDVALKAIATRFENLQNSRMVNNSNRSAEIRRLEQQIKRLQAKLSMLRKEEPASWLLSATLPREKVNVRNFDKLVTLAHTINFLQDENKRQGATTKMIYEYLTNGLALEINYATLRSYLLRSKEDGRLSYDAEKRVWLSPAK